MELFWETTWQMSFGERATVIGVLSQVKPVLALEIGTAEGAALQAIAPHCGEIHSFDLVEPSRPVPENAVLHTGDSHELLPRALQRFAEQERNVDFVMVDGDHSAAGVKQDIEDLLNSPAVAHCVILIHDIANEEVRSGVDAVRFTAWPKVAYVEPDCVPGQLYREPALHNELWHGLGLVLVDAARAGYSDASVIQERFHHGGRLLADGRDVLVQSERTGEQLAYSELARRLDEATEHIQRGYREARAPLEQALADAEAALDQELVRVRATCEQELAVVRATLEQELAGARAMLERSSRIMSDMKSSPSWRLTAPLRSLKAAATGRRT